MQHGLHVRAVHGNGASRDPRLIEGILSRVSLFRGVGQRALADLAARSKALQCRRGSTICSVNQCPPGLYAIAYGQVKLALRGGDGEERVLRIAGPGADFGLPVAILGRPLPYEVAALEDVLLVMVPTSAIFSLVENDPRFMRAVIGALAESNLDLLAEVESGSLRRGVQRLAFYLESLAEKDGAEGTFTVRLPATKTVVAARLGVKKETLSRMLRELARKGLIAVDQRKIAILDKLALAAVAREQASVPPGAAVVRTLGAAPSPS